MARHIWSVLCQTILTDSFTNSVSYILGLEELGVPSLPANAPPLAVGSLWKRGDEPNPRLATRISILAPDGNVLQRAEQPVVPFKEHARIRQNSIFGGFPFSQPGEHTVLIEQRNSNNQWIEAARIPLEIKLVTQNAMAALQQERAKAASNV